MRLRYCAICACGLLLIGTSAFAASAKKASSSVKSTAKGVEKIIAGPVALVNVEKKELAVERNGKQYPISIEGSTLITGLNNPIPLESIKAGDLVSVSYHKSPDGRRVALNIINKSFSAPVAPKTSLQSKAEPKKEPAVEKKAAAPAVAPKAEVKTEPKKEAAVAPAATAKSDVKAETKKDSAAVQPAKIPN
jgi:hypothetical protein